MYEWVLIIWTIGCGWSCDKENVIEFAVYDSEPMCEEALLDWTVRPHYKHHIGTPEYKDWMQYGDRGGQCMKRPTRNNNEQN